MLKKTIFTNQIKILLIAILSIAFSISFLAPVYAGDQEDLEQVQKELAEIRKKQQDLNQDIAAQKDLADKYGSEVAALNQEIQTLQLQVAEKELVIDELNLKISILQEQITQTEEEIIDTENDITELEEETDKRLADMYLDIKSFDNSVQMVFATEGNADFIKDGMYREAIQEDTNELLDQLALEKENLEKDKKQLEEDRVQVEADKSLLEEEKLALEQNQTVLAQKRNKFESLKYQSDTAAAALAIEYDTLSEEEKKLQAELELLKQRLFNSTNPINSGQWVKQGTIIGYEGNTGVSTGAHLHFMLKVNGSGYLNPCSYLPGAQLRNAYCGVSSPTLKQWPMTTNSYLTSGYGWRGGSFHYAIDLSAGGGTPIYAAHDGWIKYGNDGACSWYKGRYPCNGAGANYAKITCPASEPECGGRTLETGYWHLR